MDQRVELNAFLRLRRWFFGRLFDLGGGRGDVEIFELLSGDGRGREPPDTMALSRVKT